MTGQQSAPLLVPARWEQAWRPRLWVCMVVDRPHIAWVARDVLEAAGLPLGEHEADSTLEEAPEEHALASAWTLGAPEMDVVARAGDRGQELTAWLRSREDAFRRLGVDDLPAVDPADASRVGYTVEAAAEILNGDPHVRPKTGMRRLFRVLLDRGWIVRRGDGYSPTAEALIFDLITIRPAGTPVGVWDQILITPAGLEQLRHLLGTAGVIDELEVPGAR